MNLCLRLTNIYDDVSKVLMRLEKVSKLDEYNEEFARFAFKESSRCICV